MTDYQTSAARRAATSCPADRCVLREAEGRVPAPRRPTARSTRRYPPDGTRRPASSSHRMTSHRAAGIGGRLRPGPLSGPPFAQTHPDRLATVATLFRLRPAAPGACRLLELGCGDGGSLAPMAYGLPGSAFCGVDLSRRAIEHARRLAKTLGLDNLDLRHADLRGPAAARHVRLCRRARRLLVDRARRADALLAACRAHLAPHGVAYVSYDVLPGGPAEVTREMLHWHLREVSDPEASRRRARCSRRSPRPGPRVTRCARRRARAAAGRSGSVPRRAGAAPRGGPVRRLRRPCRPSPSAIPSRGRRV